MALFLESCWEDMFRHSSSFSTVVARRLLHYVVPVSSFLFHFPHIPLTFQFSEFFFLREGGCFFEFSALADAASSRR